jgi:lipopolysaccharide transport system ATP-binding protein
LEVGTGFHPELTGRENIFLNGVILGMTRADIRRRFDAIVEFAEIERFLDTPVKRYSSGMYVRLAFAVAAHVDSDILLVDEVLAVGDQAFQKKCLERMKNLQDYGRTLVFVSHNMGAISQLCERAMWLKQGQLAATGSASEVIHDYLSDMAPANVIAEFEANPERRFNFMSLKLIDQGDKATDTFNLLSPIRACLTYCTSSPIPGCEISFRVCTADGFRVFTVNRSMTVKREVEKGTFSASIEIPPTFLAPGDYFVDIAAHTPNVEMHDYKESAIRFTVVETGGDLAAYAGTKTGVVLARLPWQEART